MSGHSSHQDKSGRTMDAALKDYLKKRIQKLKEEANQDNDYEFTLRSSVNEVSKNSDDVHTPSSLSSEEEAYQPPVKSDKENYPRTNDHKDSLNRGDPNRDRRKISAEKSRNERGSDIQITIHRGRSRDRSSDRRDDRDDRDDRRTKESRSDEKHKSTKAKPSSSKSRSKRKSSDHSEVESDRSTERSSRHFKSRDKKLRKLKKEKKKKKKRKKEKAKRKEEKKTKRKKKKDDEDVELDENGEKIDYNGEEDDPEDFAEDGEVSEGEEDSEASDASGAEEAEESDNEEDTAENAETAGSVESNDDEKAPKNGRKLKADDVFERSTNDNPINPPQKIKSLSLKLSETSKDLIASGLTLDDKKKALLEDGEVSDSENEKEDSDYSDVRSDSLPSKEKRKKKKKKKDKKRKKRKRSVSTERSRSKRLKSEERRGRREESRRSEDKRRRSRSPSGRRQSPVRSAVRRRSPSPRTRRSRSPRRRRSRSPAHYQWKQRFQMTRDYRARQRSRTPVRERLGKRRPSKERERPRGKSPGLGIDKAALRAAAIKNVIKCQAKGELPVNLTKEELARLRSGASEDQKQLTEFCKNLMRRPGHPSDSEDEPTQRPVNSDSEEEDGELTEGKSSSITFNIKNAKQVPILTPAERVAHSAVLSRQFPVSSGSTHRKHEEWIPVEPKPPAPKPKPLPKPSQSMPKPKDNSTLSGIAFSANEHTDSPQTLASVAQEYSMEVTAQALQPSAMDSLPPTNIVRPEERIFPVQTRPGNIGELVTQRLAAMKRIAMNPNDVEAISQVYDANQKIEEWTSSKVVPGQFSGSTDAKILTREELEGSKKNQCWARPDQFQSAQPVKGLGMFLLEKMGWKQGTGLGKNNEGPVLPLMLDLKNDRKGLISNEEILQNQSASKPKARPIRDLSEKHPISALMELCQKRKWRSPNFIEIFENGPAHQRRFLFKVIVNQVEYQPTMGSQTKKMAKADAANVCLQALGLMPRS